MTKSGFIAIVGKPNVGKSTLLNALIGEKTAITSPKVQTTDFRMGILNELENQFIFIDTPGMHKPYHGLGKSMDKSALDALMDADSIIWVVDQIYKKTDELILNRIKESGLPTLLVINKIDELEKNQILIKLSFHFLDIMSLLKLFQFQRKNKHI